MQYYINVTSWNLLESFVTESLSPFAFYQNRNFGNNLSRYLDKSNEKTNFLILSTKDRGGDYVIKIDEALLDSSCIFLYEKVGHCLFIARQYFIKKEVLSLDSHLKICRIHLWQNLKYCLK